MKKILLANDDGYNCAGFFPLIDALKKHYEVMAVAPLVQKSWVGKSISAHHPVKFQEIEHEGHKIYAVEGTPADCVQIGLYNLIGEKPSYVVSGINVGENIGHGRILSSGTIGAAMEGAIDGVVSIAVSLCDTKNRGIDYFSPSSYHYFENAAAIVVKVIKMIEQTTLDSKIDIISINVPFDAKHDAEIEVAVPYMEPYGNLFERKDNTFTHVGAPVKYENMQDGTDIKAVFEGKIAITPISLNLASPELASKMNDELREKWANLS